MHGWCPTLETRMSGGLSEEEYIRGTPTLPHVAGSRGVEQLIGIEGVTIHMCIINPI